MTLGSEHPAMKVGETTIRAIKEAGGVEALVARIVAKLGIAEHRAPITERDPH